MRHPWLAAEAFTTSFAPVVLFRYEFEKSEAVFPGGNNAVLGLRIPP